MAPRSSALTALALAVSLVTLLCAAGPPAPSTGVLSQYTLSPAMHHACLGVHILGYIADDGVMVATAVAARRP